MLSAICVMTIDSLYLSWQIGSKDRVERFKSSSTSLYLYVNRKSSYVKSVLKPNDIKFYGSEKIMIKNTGSMFCCV